MSVTLYQRYEIVFYPTNWGGKPLEEILNRDTGGALGEYVRVRGGSPPTPVPWIDYENDQPSVRACVPADKTPDEVLHEMDEQLQPLGWAIFDWRAQ